MNNKVLGVSNPGGVAMFRTHHFICVVSDVAEGR